MTDDTVREALAWLRKHDREETIRDFLTLWSKTRGTSFYAVARAEPAHFLEVVEEMKHMVAQDHEMGQQEDVIRSMGPGRREGTDL